MRAAIVQDWLAVEAGSERVALELGRLLPTADIYTSFFDPAIFDGELAKRRVYTWPLQAVPGARRRFRSLYPLYPAWFSRLDLRAYDVVVSSSVAFSHAVRTAATAVHVAYIHTPLRYAWDLDRYLRGGHSAVTGAGARLLAPLLRVWDRRAAQGPTELVANSATVRERIRVAWKRDAQVIHPPVDVEKIPIGRRDDGYLFIASRLLAYRNIDHAVVAANRLGRDLVIVGDGPQQAALAALAGPSVRLMGRTSRTELLSLLGRCHAYVVAGEEDFGIAPVEAMAAGKPVVGLRAGGVVETVIDGETGVLYDGPDPEHLGAAIKRLDSTTFSQERIRRHAERFDTKVFRARFAGVLDRYGVIVGE